jgi:acetyl-CoA acetyltransferase
MRDKTVIAGVGRTKVDRERKPDYLRYLGRALKAAVEDAGLSRGDIDGIMLNMVPATATMDKLPEMLGLPNVTFAFQSWFHGRMQPTCIGVAAWAVMTGQAKYVACMSAGQMLHGPQRVPGVQSDQESDREGGGPHLEAPPYGMTSIGAGAAMAMRKYMLKYGGRPEDLGAIAVAQRQWAQLQPEAYFHGRPMSLQDYMNAPIVVEPLRVPDHCMAGNAAFCIIVTTAERAADCRKRPVYISGLQGSASGSETFVFSRTGLGIGQQREEPYNGADMNVYKMAKVGPRDINILGCLDAFSPLVLFGLEEFGFCKEGEALSWVQNGRTAPGGELPVNICGGGLSDIESFGWGHQVDMVRQLRGEAGTAQQRNVEVCQYLSTDRSSIILTVK